MILNKGLFRKILNSNNPLKTSKKMIKKLRAKHIAPYLMIADRGLLLYIVIKVVEYLDKLI